jgi:uncharacterized integral membrane protein
MAERADKAGQRKDEHFAPTRTSRAWWTLGAGLLVLILVIVFMLQNGDEVSVRFLWLHGRLSLGLALLIAAVLGALCVLLLGAARMLQMRLQARRAHREGPDGAVRSAGEAPR